MTSVYYVGQWSSRENTTIISKEPYLNFLLLFKCLLLVYQVTCNNKVKGRGKGISPYSFSYLFSSSFSLSHVQLFATLWTAVLQALLSMGFPRQEYWSGLPFPLPGDLSNPGIEPTSPALAGGFFTTEPLGKPYLVHTSLKYYKSQHPKWFHVILGHLEAHAMSSVILAERHLL